MGHLCTPPSPIPIPPPPSPSRRRAEQRLASLARSPPLRNAVWVVAVVWEMEPARETQAQLAVADERLRVSRDLHDVMGRNLTTIALKS
ncbi:hypothetical protein UK12_33855, partial [Saccharothrix sp. ST-888]